MLWNRNDFTAVPTPMQVSVPVLNPEPDQVYIYCSTGFREEKISKNRFTIKSSIVFQKMASCVYFLLFDKVSILCYIQIQILFGNRIRNDSSSDSAIG
jgi:hypothetical protein